MPYISGQHDPNILFIAGHNGGIWKTTNLQISNNEVNVIFNPLTDHLPTQSAGAIGIDPTDPQIIYYASGGSVMYFAYNFYGIGVFKSTNGGLNWAGPYNTGLPRLTHSFRITVSPNHDVYLALGMDDVDGGLYKSTDGGLNWAHAPDITLQKTCNDVIISNNGQYIYALGESPVKGGIGYWISTNSGQSFTDYTQSSGLLIPNYQRGRSQMSISKGYENYVYVVTVAHNTEAPEWVYGFVSTDYGFTFGEHKYINGAYGLMSSDFMDIKASPHNPEIAVVGFGSGGAPTIFMTTNGGNTYPQMSNCGSFPGTDINSIDFNPNPSYPNQVVVGCDQGLFINDNVLYPSEYCWKFLNKTLSLSQVYRVSSNPFNFNNINIAITDAGILRKRLDQTNNWDETFVGCDGTNILFSKYNNGIVIGSTGINKPRPNGCGSNMMYSSNGGLNWSNNENPFGGYWDGDQDWIAVLTEYPRGGKFYHARRQEQDHRKIEFYYTTDGGQTWNNNPGSNHINPLTTVDLERQGVSANVNIC